MIPALLLMQFATPILLLVFNRPDYLARQIEILRQIRPTRLYISGDGPRSNYPSDAEAIAELKMLLKKIDWQCELHSHFRTQNLGCKVGVSSGIDWFFSSESEGIILEDDCLPDQSFFPFCAELLKKYRHDQQVGHISGTNLFHSVLSPTSYFFSIHPICWGWATWRRAWKNYDVQMADWPTHGKSVLEKQFSSPSAIQHWSSVFQKTWQGEIDTWDYQWIYSCWKNNLLSITPTQNLVENIGFDSRATHTKFSFSPLAHLPKKSLTFPLKHPTVQPNEQLDQQAELAFFEKPLTLKLFEGVGKLIKRWLTRMLK